MKDGPCNAIPRAARERPVQANGDVFAGSLSSSVSSGDEIIANFGGVPSEVRVAKIEPRLAWSLPSAP
jgi:hypothetical protein